MTALHGDKHVRVTFHKIERLKSRKEIETLFHQGEAFYIGKNLRIIYRIAPLPSPTLCKLQVGFSVPKKKVRLANKRNRIKRLLKEAWRLQKQQLYEQIPSDKQLHVFIIFLQNSSHPYTFPQAQQHIEKAITQLAKTIAVL